MEYIVLRIPVCIPYKKFCPCCPTEYDLEKMVCSRCGRTLFIAGKFYCWQDELKKDLPDKSSQKEGIMTISLFLFAVTKKIRFPPSPLLATAGRSTINK